MAIHARRVCVLALAATLALGACAQSSGRSPPAGAALPDAAALPAGVVPLRQPVALQFRNVGAFTYTWRSEVSGARSAPTIGEGWMMRGTMRTEGDRRGWSYTLANIGRNGGELPIGTIQATTDPWGAVSSASVDTSAWPNAGRLWLGLFDPANLSFPLKCPRETLTMGSVVGQAQMAELRANLRAAGMPETVDARTTVAGTLARGGRTYVVLRLDGGGRISRGGESATVSLSGYRTRDIDTCMPGKGAWTMTVRMENDPHGRWMSIAHQESSTY